MLEVVADLFGVPFDLLFMVSEAQLDAYDFLPEGASDTHCCQLCALPDQKQLPDVLIFDRTKSCYGSWVLGIPWKSFPSWLFKQGEWSNYPLPFWVRGESWD